MRLPKNEPAVDELVIIIKQMIIWLRWTNFVSFSYLMIFFWKQTGEWISNSNISIDASVECNGVVRHWPIHDPYRNLLWRNYHFYCNSVQFTFQVFDQVINYYFVLSLDLRDYVFISGLQNDGPIETKSGIGSALNPMLGNSTSFLLTELFSSPINTTT